MPRNEEALCVKLKQEYFPFLHVQASPIGPVNTWRGLLIPGIARPQNLTESQVVSYKYYINNGLSDFWLKTQPLSVRYGKFSCFHNLVQSPGSSHSMVSFYSETFSPLLSACLLSFALPFRNLGLLKSHLGFSKLCLGKTYLEVVNESAQG